MGECKEQCDLVCMDRVQMIRLMVMLMSYSHVVIVVLIFLGISPILISPILYGIKSVLM